MTPRPEVERAFVWLNRSLEELEFGEINLRVVVHQRRIAKVHRSITTTHVQSGVHSGRPPAGNGDALHDDAAGKE